MKRVVVGNCNESVLSIGLALYNRGEEIVFVGVTSGHRSSAFLAAEFIMDYMKTKAPFWKEEHLTQGQSSRWVKARLSDQAAFQRW